MDKSQRSKGDLEKVTLRLFAGDVDFLSELYPKAGYNRVIRQVVHDYVKRLQNKLNQQEIPDGTTIPNLDLPLAGSGEGESE